MNDTIKKTTTNPAGTITNMIAPAGYWNLLDSLAEHKTDSPEHAAIQKQIEDMIGADSGPGSSTERKRDSAELVLDMGRAVFPKFTYLLQDEKRMLALAAAVAYMMTDDGRYDREPDQREIVETWQAEFAYLQTPREIPAPDAGKRYATEENARRAALRVKIDGRFQIVPVEVPVSTIPGVEGAPMTREIRFRVIFFPSSSDEIPALLSLGHQVIA